jgi:hypothetical protein
VSWNFASSWLRRSLPIQRDRGIKRWWMPLWNAWLRVELLPLAWSDLGDKIRDRPCTSTHLYSICIRPFTLKWCFSRSLEHLSWSLKSGIP